MVRAELEMPEKWLGNRTHLFPALPSWQSSAKPPYQLRWMTVPEQWEALLELQGPAASSEEQDQRGDTWWQAESTRMTQTAASDSLCPAPSEGKSVCTRGHRATTPKLLACGWEGPWVWRAVISVCILCAALTSRWYYDRAIRHRAMTPQWRKRAPFYGISVFLTLLSLGTAPRWSYCSHQSHSSCTSGRGIFIPCKVFRWLTVKCKAQA